MTKWEESYIFQSKYPINIRFILYPVTQLKKESEILNPLGFIIAW